MYHDHYHSQLAAQTVCSHIREQVPALLNTLNDYRHVQNIREAVEQSGLNRSMVRVVQKMIPQADTPAYESFNTISVPSKDPRAQTLLASLESIYNTRQDSLTQLKTQLIDSVQQMQDVLQHLISQYTTTLSTTDEKTVESYQTQISEGRYDACTLPDDLHTETMIGQMTQITQVLSNLGSPEIKDWDLTQVAEAMTMLEQSVSDMSHVMGYQVTQHGANITPAEMRTDKVAYERIDHLGYGHDLVSMVQAAQTLAEAMDSFLSAGYAESVATMLTYDDPEFDEDKILPEPGSDNPAAPLVMPEDEEIAPSDDLEDTDPEEGEGVAITTDIHPDEADPSEDPTSDDPAEDPDDPIDEDIPPENDIEDDDPGVVDQYVVNRLQAVAQHVMYTTSVLNTATQMLSRVTLALDTLEQPNSSIFTGYY